MAQNNNSVNNNQAQGYKDPVLTALINALEENGPPELKGKYYYGDVMLVPKDQLPICSVARDRTRIGQASDLEDDNLMPLVINILYDYTADLTNDYNVVAGVNSLYRLVEARNPSNYAILPGTIAWVLRNKQQLANKLFLAVGPSEVLDIDYGLGVERRGPGIFSVESVIRVSARAHTPRPGVEVV